MVPPFQSNGNLSYQLISIKVQLREVMGDVATFFPAAACLQIGTHDPYHRLQYKIAMTGCTVDFDYFP